MLIKSATRNLFLTGLLMAAAMTGLSSCSDSNVARPDEDVNDGKITLALHITPLRTSRVTGSTNTDMEMVKSLRIVILNDQYVECNKLVTFPGNGVPVAQMNYDYLWQTVPGTKTFYLIANEESVNGLQYQFDEGATPPEGPYPSTLTDLCETYLPDSDVAISGDDFETMINAVYFQPDYTAQSGNLYLPYISRYTEQQALPGASEQGGVGVTDIKMYMVPVATKFLFNFVNWRPDPVEVTGISIDNIDDNNFLLARLAGSEIEKNFEGTSYYWVDWLAKVSEASQSATGYYENEEFNGINGWITSYSMPTASTLATSTLFSTEQGESYMVPGAQDEETPSNLAIGPFYQPESKNLVQNTDASGQLITFQQYYLTIGLNDTDPNSTAPDFSGIGINNLQALFRNTNVVINITMRGGDIEIYAEIADWVPATANGWVIED